MTPDAASRSAAARSTALPPGFGNALTFLLLIAGYLGWQVLVRLATSNSAELDEGEQLLLTQRLDWGYGPQPPLYTWLQYPFIQALGPSILPLALLKNLLLCGTYLFTFLSARRLTRAHLPAVAAALSLLFVPEISWESQRDLTHSVLVTMLAAATLYVFLGLSKSRRPWRYLAFGVCAALGTLAKYSYLIGLAGLLLAALTLPSMRATVLNRWMFLALALAALLVAPHVHWALQHRDAVLASAGKFSIATGRPWLDSTFSGAKNLVRSTFTHIGALLGLYFLLCLKRPAAPATSTPDPNGVRLVGRSLVTMFALLALAIVGFRVTSFKDRWLLPVLIGLPVYLAAKLAPRLNAARVRAMIGLGVVVMVAVSILLPGRIWFAERLRKPDQPNAPFDRLTVELRPMVSADAVLLAADPWLGGNLRMFFPGHTIVTPQWPLERRWREGDECAVIWDATRADAPPAALSGFAAVNATMESAHFIAAPLKFYHTNQMRLGLMIGRLKEPAQ